MVTVNHSRSWMASHAAVEEKNVDLPFAGLCEAPYYAAGDLVRKMKGP